MILNGYPILDSTAFEERYYLLEESQLVSRSRAGMLFKAFDAYEQQEVFVKIYSADSLALSEEQNFHELIRLRHKNLVSLLSFFRLAPPSDSTYSESLPVLVMNYIAGKPLSSLTFPLPYRLVEAIETQLVDVLNYLHEQGWVHRDLKPENVLVQDVEGAVTVTVCDLEQAGRINHLPTALVGTPEYMAPGAATWQPLEARFDFWSLGCLLYQLLTGELPFGIRDFSMEPLESIKQIQERIQQADMEQLIDQLPTVFQNRMKIYWGLTCQV